MPRARTATAVDERQEVKAQAKWLRISKCYVDEGPTIKRWRARARGRVARIKKHTCHVTIRLVPGESSTPTRRPRRAQAAAAAEPEVTEETPKKPARRRPANKAEAQEPKPKTSRSRKKPQASDATEEA